VDTRKYSQWIQAKYTNTRNANTQKYTKQKKGTSSMEMQIRDGVFNGMVKGSIVSGYKEMEHSFWKKSSRQNHTFKTIIEDEGHTHQFIKSFIQQIKHNPINMHVSF
jgi:hypothetical protein